MLGGRTAQIFAFALKTLVLSVLLAVFGAFSANAEDAVSVAEAPAKPAISEASPAKTETINKTLIAELEPSFRVVLEGEDMPDNLVSKDKNGGIYVRAEPIFEALDDDFEFDAEEGVLLVQRSQDGVVMELYTDTGIVKANGKPLGKLKIFGEVSAGKINLTPNAIAVLSGAIGKVNAEQSLINFELDPRLKVATGFDMFVNDVPLGQVEPGPKSVGSVLLLPLGPIAKALGHEVTVLDGGTSVKVRRAQDSALFELNLDTGLVKLNGRPHGVTKNVTYIDSFNLLLPVSAIETLTGTHVDVEGGTSRINITLDERLGGAVKPGKRVDDVTKAQPFTLETLNFHIGNDTLNTASAEFHVKNFNGRLRYEIPDIPGVNGGGLAEAEPSWLSLDWANVKGGYGSIGDYSADLRELDGVGLRRIRGASYVKETEKGRWAAAAGMPVSGSKKISEDQSRLTFGGLAAGVRYADRDGWEAGLSAKSDSLSDDQMAVLSAISGRLGRKVEKDLNWSARGDIGVFSGPAREKSVDIRVAGNARYEVSQEVSVDVFAGYDGVEFLRGDLDAEERQAEIEQALTGDAPSEDDEAFVPDLRKAGKDQLSYGASVQYAARNDFGPIGRPAASLRYSATKSGAFAGKEAAGAVSVQTFGGTLTGRINPVNANVSMDYTAYKQALSGNSSESGDQLSIRAFKDTKYAGLRLQYTNSKRGQEARESRIDAQITAKPVRLPLPKEARLSVAPSIAASKSQTNSYVRGGVVANLDSGDMLGSKTKLQASLGVLQSFSSNSENKSDKFLSVSIGRQLPINKNLQLGLTYRNDLSGAQRVGITLDGRFDFNEKRRFKATRDGRGVLKGRAFLDKNRDGIKQDDEQGIGGALIRVKGTSMALRSDRDGFYTIQNIKEGLHELQVDGKSLPLGFTLADDVSTKATIREGHITELPLPIIQRGQILGFAFVDENGDGAHTKGEKRLEGAKLFLQDIDNNDKTYEVYASTFGQYAFDDLPSGQYKLSIAKTNAPDCQPNTEPIIVDLASADNLMARMNVAAIAKSDQPPKLTLEAGLPDEIPPPEIPPDKDRDKIPQDTIEVKPDIEPAP